MQVCLVEEHLLLRLDDLFVAIAGILVQNLAGFVNVSSTVLIDEVYEQAVCRMFMMAAADVVLFTGHGCH